jgi:Polysaccharide lyase
MTSGFAVNLAWTPIESGAPRSYFVIYRDGEELTAGVTGSTYRDSSISAGEIYEYQVSTVLVTETEGAPGDASAVIVPGYPVWETGWSLSLSVGSSLPVSDHASDPLSYPLTYSRVGGTAPAGVVISISGAVSVNSGAAGGYTLILRASNGYLYSDITVSMTVVSVNQAPSFTVAPPTASFGSSGGTIQFTAVDPEGATIIYSVSAYRSGFTIDQTGLVTVPSSAAGTEGDIVVVASDGVLTESVTCSVSVAAIGTGIVIHDVGFETGAFPPTSELNTSGTTTGRSIVSNGTARLGTYHSRFSLAKSVGTRMELASMKRDVLFCNTLTTPIPREQWLGMSVRLVNHVSDTASNDVLMQHHPNNAVDLSGNVQVLTSGTPGFEDWYGAPVCSLRTVGPNWHCNMRSTPYAPGDPLRPADGGDMNVHTRETVWASDNNHWTDWVFHVIWDWRVSGGTGLWEVWRRGQSTSGAWLQLVDYSGPTGINNWTSNWRGCMPYWKFGIYKANYASSAFSTRTVEFDAIKLIYGGGVFADVAPSGTPT